MINHYTIWFDFSWPQKYQVPTILTSTGVVFDREITEYGGEAWMGATSNAYDPFF